MSTRGGKKTAKAGDFEIFAFTLGQFESRCLEVTGQCVSRSTTGLKGVLEIFCKVLTPVAQWIPLLEAFPFKLNQPNRDADSLSHRNPLDI